MAPPAPVTALGGLSRSPEREILEAFVALVRADSLLSSAFKPIVIVESPTREALDTLGAFTAAIQPYIVRPVEFPSRRETTNVGILVSLWVPTEQNEQDSPLWGLDLGSHLRALATSTAPLKKGNQSITQGVPNVLQLTPLITTSGARILSYRVVYEADIDPSTGAFA